MKVLQRADVVLKVAEAVLIEENRQKTDFSNLLKSVISDVTLFRCIFFVKAVPF